MPEEERKKWQVELTLSGGKKFFRVFRLKDPDREYSTENRETRGGLYERYIDADRLRNTLNVEEARKK